VVGLQGYSALQAARHRRADRVHLGVLQHPRGRAAVRRAALSATVGCGFTAQLGAMRISEEIDALEVMARAAACVPGDHPGGGRVRRGDPALRWSALAGLSGSRQTTVWFYGQSGGTYDHYFHVFLPPGDVLWSFLKVLVFRWS